MDHESKQSEIYIRAINPGYTIDGQSNVGELIEIARTNPDDQTPISLAGIILGYTNSAGNSVNLVEFPENSWMTGERLLLHCASSSGSELANLSYSKSLAQKAGPLELKRGEEILDSVCWTGKEGCEKEFKSNSPTTLVWNPELSTFEHLSEYTPLYNQNSYFVEEPEIIEEPDEKPSRCSTIEFSEILTYYESLQSEQFIELYNPASEQVLLDGCGIKYKNRVYPLSGTIDADGYFLRPALDFILTKNPTSSNVLELVDPDGKTIRELIYYNGQQKGTSYAMIGYDEGGIPIWKNTFYPTPGSANIYQQYKTCEEGKVLNEETGNCVKVTAISEKTCEEGKELNPETGRCRKIATATEEPKTCKEGYFLNPATNRCNKIATNTGADYSLRVTPAEEQQSSFIALGAVIVLIIVAIAFAVFEFRREIKNWAKRLFHRAQ